MNKNNKIFYIGRKLRLKKILYLFWFIKEILYYRGILWGKLTSIKDILAGKYPNVEILSYENIRLSYSTPVFNDGLKIKSDLSEGKDYHQYALLIKNAIVYGNANLIDLTSKKVLFDMPVFDESRRYQYNNDNTKIVKIKGNNIFYWKGITRKMEKAICMVGNFSWNYYHFLYEFVVKFIQLNKLNIPLDTPVLIDQICLEIPQYKELLDIANNKGYKLIGADRRRRVKVGELIYISSPNFIPPNTKNNDFRADDVQFNINTLHNLRNYLLPYSSQKEFPKRIFISRKNASSRRKFNENEVIQLFSEYGFEVVFPETLSVADQISLFNQAEWIVGGSGAAFTNLLFCRPNTKVVMFLKTQLPTSTFSTIASAVNIDLLYITEEDTNKNICFGNVHDTFELNLSYLRNLIIKLGL